MGRQVKDVHAIAVPSWASAKMAAQICNSIVTLNTVDNGVRRLDEGKGLPVSRFLLIMIFTAPFNLFF